MKVTKMIMLKWMNEYIRKDNIQNDYIWKNVNVAPIEEKIMEVRLWKFGHMCKEVR